MEYFLEFYWEFIIAGNARNLKNSLSAEHKMSMMLHSPTMLQPLLLHKCLPNTHGTSTNWNFLILLWQDGATRKYFLLMHTCCMQGLSSLNAKSHINIDPYISWSTMILSLFDSKNPSFRSASPHSFLCACAGYQVCQVMIAVLQTARTIAKEVNSRVCACRHVTKSKPSESSQMFWEWTHPIAFLQGKEETAAPTLLLVHRVIYFKKERYWY